MNTRQVHLDFHTSEKLKDIGSRFSKEKFQNALITGHVNSITVFAKCHHGWAYFPSETNDIHPELKFDLLEAWIEAAHEINVKTPIYLSVGLDEKIARVHPEWLRRQADDRINWTDPGYHEFCLNSPYLDVIIAQIEEVVQKYDGDGIFLDIVGVKPCWCQNCINTLLKEGKDPYDAANINDLAERVYANYTKRVLEVVNKHKPGHKIFHNSGHIRRGRRDLAHVNTHLELESLPTGGWGYDHFPLSAAYARTLGMDFLGMTGKFHTTWGEFGGFKHPNALRYEAALSLANGAKCSIGDQLHPSGHMEEATYKLIGEAYKEVELKEPWCDNVESVADIAILSEEAMANYYSVNMNPAGDVGAARIMLEGKYLFDIIDVESDLDKYKLLLLPDSIRLDGFLINKIQKFVDRGGKILATGKSSLLSDKDEFAFDLGAKYVSESKFNPTYIRPLFDMRNSFSSSYVIYSKAHDIEAKEDAEIIALREDPFFNRTTFAFSSHRHTPNDVDSARPAITVGKHGAYISTELFREYSQTGSLIAKEVVIHTIDVLLDKTLETDLPAQGVVTLMNQRENNRLVNHLLYASPVKRGNGVEVIEDIIPLYNIQVKIKCDHTPKRVYIAPDMTDIPYSYEIKTVSYTVPKLFNHSMVVIEY